MKYVLTMTAVLFLSIAFFTSAYSQVAYVDEDLKKAYQQITGKNFDAEVRRLTSADSSQSIQTIDTVVQSDASKVNTPDIIKLWWQLNYRRIPASLENLDEAVGTPSGSGKRPRCVVYGANGQPMFHVYIKFTGNMTDLNAIGLRIKLFSTKDSTGSIMFPVDFLPRLSVIPGVKLIYPGEPIEIRLD